MRKTISFGCRKITANLHRNKGLLEAKERLVRQKVCSFCLVRVKETMGIIYAIGQGDGTLVLGGVVVINLFSESAGH